MSTRHNRDSGPGRHSPRMEPLECRVHADRQTRPRPRSQDTARRGLLDEFITAEIRRGPRPRGSGNQAARLRSAAIAANRHAGKHGHTICCPSFSCAYADAVLDGTLHDHAYYTCSCCTWTDWGGGDSSFRCVGTDESCCARRMIRFRLVVRR